MLQYDLKKQCCRDVRWGDSYAQELAFKANAQEILKQTPDVPICLDSELTSS